MSRLFLIPQNRTHMRYQDWFFDEFPLELRKRFDEVIVIGEDIWKDKKPINFDSKMFSPIDQSIRFELVQIDEYLSYDFQDDDILLLMDLSFPGIFTNILYHKRPKNCFAYLHASSRNYLDYFSKDVDSKFMIESGNAKLFKKIFVGSEYSKRKVGWDNIEVIGLPKPPFQTYENEEKVYDIISVARPCDQKVTKKIEDMVEIEYGPIVRKRCDTWDEYYKFLGQSKILLITSNEDTFNYSIMDAVLNNCIPLAPYKLCFPELLSPLYLYSGPYDLLVNRIPNALSGDYDVPDLLNWDKIENFYDNLSKKIKESLD